MSNSTYETMVIVDAMIADDAVQGEFEKIEGTIAAHDGEITHTDNWGKRKMAYDIRKKSHGHYAVYYYNADVDVVADLEKQFRINENILRWMTLKDQPVNPELFIGRQGGEEEGIASVEEKEVGVAPVTEAATEKSTEKESE